MDLLWRTGTIESDDEEIYWELTDLGEGDDRPVVVLSHGAGGSHAVWYQQVPVVGVDYRIVTWDSRGFGNSTNRSGAPNPALAAADLGRVLDHLAIDRAHLVGQSMGGWHIAAFALENAGRVASLTFADTVGGLWTPELREAMDAFGRRGGLQGGGPPRIGYHRALWEGTTARHPAHAFLYQALGSFHSPPLDKLGDTLAFTVEHGQIEALGVPVLFIAGTHDEIFPAPLLAASCEAIAGARFVEIPAAGHSPYFEQPEAWNDALLRFLAEATE